MSFSTGKNVDNFVTSPFTGKLTFETSPFTGRVFHRISKHPRLQDGFEKYIPVYRMKNCLTGTVLWL
jgi:hypothetical protein